VSDDSSKSVGEIIGSALSGAVAGFIVPALLAILTGIGIAHTNNLEDPKNWPAWLVLLALYLAYHFGWKALSSSVAMWLVPAASGKKIGVLIARLEGDKTSDPSRETVREAIKKDLGDSVEIILSPITLRLGTGRDSDAERHARDKAQEWLAAKQCDLLLWGRVKGDRTLSLRLTLAGGDPTPATSYGLTPDTLELPLKFVSDLGSAIAARVVVSVTSADGANRAQRLPQVRIAAERLQPIIEPLNAAFDADTRGTLLFSYALVRETIGDLAETKDDLLAAVDAYRATLNEWTRERAPNDWAMVQNNLANTLRTLAEREDSTPRLQQAIAALRAALEEMAPERNLLSWAGAHFNLGLALRRLDAREGSVAHLEEAITAFRGGLRESSRERVPPLLAAMIRSNLGDTLQTVAENRHDPARLEEAVAVYREALNEWTRAADPETWAGLQNDLGTTLVALAERENGTARLEEAVGAFRAALAGFESAADTDHIEMAKENLALAEQSLADRQKQAKQRGGEANAPRLTGPSV
jgi:tetratricopeptide (TPR) repeat protein